MTGSSQASSGPPLRYFWHPIIHLSAERRYGPNSIKFIPWLTSVHLLTRCYPYSSSPRPSTAWVGVHGSRLSQRIVFGRGIETRCPDCGATSRGTNINHLNGCFMVKEQEEWERSHAAWLREYDRDHKQEARNDN